jgi:hypothetical protein
MDSLTTTETGTQFDARDDLDAEPIASHLRLGNTRHRVMVGQGQYAQTTCNGLLYQRRW